LLEDAEIESVMNNHGKRSCQNLYDPSGNKISYYQINATFFYALGENEQKLLLAVIQMFMPGIPQIWYLDILQVKIIMKRRIMEVVLDIKKLIALSMNDIEEG
jgi:sucrose phosphorylase